jgi:hypothetical protein
MSVLSPTDIRLIEELFETGGGYVLDFTNRSFSDFFRHIGIDIDSRTYSEEGGSKGKRLRRFFLISSKATTSKALSALWEYRETLVRLGKVKSADPFKDDMGRLFAKLGVSSPIPPTAGKDSISEPPTVAYSSFSERLMNLANLDAHKRGYEFEKYLKDLFDAFGLRANNAFRLTGEQIDGSFMLCEEVYLLEAKWQNSKVGVADLHGFHGKLGEKADWTRGLFVSFSGFSDEGLEAFGRGKRLICMDGFDISELLSIKLSLRDVLSLKMRRAGETGRPYISVRDLV